MFDVFFYEAFEEEAEALRRHLPARVRAGFSWKTIQEAGESAPAAPVISIRTQSVIPPAWAGSLKAILTRSTGYDHITACRRQCGVAVPAGYLPLYCHRAVAEHAILLAMALLRRLPRQTGQFQRFHRDGLTGRECGGRKLLVVGVGNIGSEVVRIGQALGMEPRGIDIVRRYAFVPYTTLEESLPWAEVIVCAMNLTAQNIGYFRYDVLRVARRGAVFVNVSRGEFSPSADLLRLLEEGALGGVGLDVYNRESALAVSLRDQCPSDDAEVRATLALSARSDAILTPHNAFNTAESVERKAAQSVEQVVHLLDRGVFLWPVPE